MIASLRGEVIAIALDHAVIECGGVGYCCLATPATLAELTRGTESLVLTAMVVKEDSMTLYGFSTAADREMFHILQKVSGLGAKLAMAALSVLSAQELATAIVGDDVKALQRIPGVGKRMAERMALELQDKVTAHLPAAGENAAVTGGAAALPAAVLPVAQQVVEALVGLGFNEKTARPVVESVIAESGEEPDTAVVLRAALSQLGRS